MITNLKDDEQHKHKFGGGWVSNNSRVDDSVYVGPLAIVYGHSVCTGTVRIEDYAQVKDSKLSGDVIVRRVAWVEGVTAKSGIFEYNEKSKTKAERIGQNLPYEGE